MNPNGLVTFLSKCFGGRLGDREITLSSGFLPLLDTGDIVMADRGFDVEEELAEYGIVLNMPPKLGKQKRFAASEVEKTRWIAELRFHVERCIRRAHCFDILNCTLPISMAEQLDDIVNVCFF